MNTPTEATEVVEAQGCEELDVLVVGTERIHLYPESLSLKENEISMDNVL